MYVGVIFMNKEWSEQNKKLQKFYTYVKMLNPLEQDLIRFIHYVKKQMLN